MPRKRKEEVTIEPGNGLNLDPEPTKQRVPGTLDRATINEQLAARNEAIYLALACAATARGTYWAFGASRLGGPSSGYGFAARLEERRDSVRACLSRTIKHWSMNLNPPHKGNSGYLTQLTAGPRTAP